MIRLPAKRIMSGGQTVTELRKMIKKEVPFILMTAYGIIDTINKSEEISTDGSKRLGSVKTVNRCEKK